MATLPRFFLSMLLIGAGDSFSPLTNMISPLSVIKSNNNIIPTQQLNARNSDITRNGNHLSRHSNDSNVRHHGTPKRVPQNKRTAIRWVIQGVERCLATEEEEVSSENNKRGGGGKSYKRRIDASLVDALYLMVNANCQKDVLDAEKRVQVLMKNPKEFPTEVNERVIKATAMAGLSSLSLTLLKACLHQKDSDTVPSPMAYTAVLNALRKNGRIDRLEETLADLAGASRRVSHTTGKKGAGIEIDIVAFNTYLAAICDAAINEVPFPSASSSSTMDDNDDDILGFNFTSLTNHSTSTSSEKYLYKALNLLRGDAARTRFALEKDPDEYSYNSVLNAAAKCSNSDENDHFSKSIMLSCLRGMKKRGLQADILTYNARIQAALAQTDGEEAVIRIIDQLLSDNGVEPDRYTINFMLKPFIKSGRKDEIWSILIDFYDKYVGSNGKIISSAFEAFLTTIVQTGEIEFAREIFQYFFLPRPKPKQNKRFQMSQTVHVMGEEEQLQQEDDSMNRDSVSTMLPSMTYPSGSTGRQNRPSPRTRHFNVLLGGYSKAYQSAVSRHGKSRVLTTAKKDDTDTTKEELENFPNNITMPDIQKAYELLDVMLSIGVPLDGFSITSLMSLPYSTSEDITSLLTRIEPEMMVEFNPAAYRSIISAYGKAGDPSSACWMFEEMTQSCGRNQGNNVGNWNVLLGSLAKGCVGTGGTSDDALLDIPNSIASRARRNLQSQSSVDGTENQLISLINGQTCLDASMTMLATMRRGIVLPEGYKAPRPNSQSYCLIVSGIYGSASSEANSDLALELFREAMKEGVAADGRFLNAVLRCFGDDIEGALTAWKTEVGPAAAAYERISKNRGTNIIAAYNGLMHVCGSAIRPDVATRIAYAMTKAGVEPSEVTLNSYHAGKRVALGGKDDGKNMGLRNQYESLLSVECTKYSTKDKRRAGDRKIRIIF